MNQDYDFPVELQNVFLSNGELIPKSRVCVRTDTNKAIGAVVSDRYALFTHKQAVDKTTPFIESFGSYKVTNFLEKDGARFIREYTFGKQVVELKTPALGDTVHMRLSIVNSYGLGTPVAIVLSAMVLRCLNGMTVPKGLFELSFRHTGDLQGLHDVTLPEPSVVLNMFKSAGEVWEAWGSRYITSDEQEFVAQNALKMQVVSKTSFDKYPELLQPVGDNSRTFWNYYNNFTNVITHKLSARAQQSGRLGRFDKLNAVFAAASSSGLTQAGIQ